MRVYLCVYMCVYMCVPVVCVCVCIIISNFNFFPHRSFCTGTSPYVQNQTRSNKVDEIASLIVAGNRMNPFSVSWSYYTCDV